MTTVAEAINQLRLDYLLTGRREQRNRLASAVDADDTTLAFEFTIRGIQEGGRLSVGLEDIGVWSINAGAKTASVQRGDYGSTAATHADGDIVLINPKWSDAQILRAMNDELEALSSPASGLYQVDTVDITYNASKQGYDLENVTDLISVWDVRYQAIGPETEWPRIRHWEHQRDSDTTDFPSGHALFIRSGADPGQTVRVWYKKPFTTLSSASQDITAISGLPATAIDVVIMGSALRLIAGREVTRNLDESQGDTRRAEEVPAGANLRAMGGILNIYKRRVRQEAARLSRHYMDHR